MKILITGMNKNQCVKDFYLRQQLKVVPSHYSLIRCLEDMGHEVVQSTLEDMPCDLAEFDQAIIFLAAPRQLVTVQFYDCLKILSKFPNAILAFDDWQTKGILDGLDKCVDNYDELYNGFTMRNNKEPKFASCDKQDHKLALEIIKSRKNRVLLSVFAGGDMTRLIEWPEDLLYGYNPNPYHLNRAPGHYSDVSHADMDFLEYSQLPSVDSEIVQFKNKQKIFNFASLVQSQTQKWLKKQDIKIWDIEFFGSKKDGQRRLTEGEMCKVFAQQWGCLMPGYEHAGSGWWRARPLQVADATSICIGDPAEMMLYYKDEELANLTAHDVERMTDDELAQTAIDQSVAINANHPLDQEIQVSELEKVLS